MGEEKEKKKKRVAGVAVWRQPSKEEVGEIEGWKENGGRKEG